jgi:hypothetical protein
MPVMTELSGSITRNIGVNTVIAFMRLWCHQCEQSAVQKRREKISGPLQDMGGSESSSK